MLFNSHVFVFLFLPLTACAFFLVRRMGRARAAIGVLVCASIVYYGWWNPPYLLLIAASIAANYAIGISLSRSIEGGDSVLRRNRRLLLAIGVVFNLSLLGYFKYRKFFADNVDSLFGTQMELGDVFLPLAISFFTFQQIAYLVDAWRGEAKEYDFLHYVLFVTFFPQLIAGPIVHHKEMMPQFMRELGARFNWTDIAVGLTIFSIGLFKKTVLADRMAPYVNELFRAGAAGQDFTLTEAWFGPVAYGLQLYFDFSGYSDMAIGAARIFGVILPINFDSPYKAANISDLWVRWHMTLQRFLRSYIYIPLGGNRGGLLRQQFNIFIVFLVSGFWHGAGWNFVLFGVYHGIAVITHGLWRRFRVAIGWSADHSNRWTRTVAVVLTLICWIFGLAVFRSHNLDAIWSMWQGMVGLHGFVLHTGTAESLGVFAGILAGLGAEFSDTPTLYYDSKALILMLALGAIALFLPNTQEIMHHYEPGINLERNRVYKAPKFVAWRPGLAWGVFAAALLVLGILHITRYSEFIYFQF